MRKSLVALIAVLLAVALAGCGYTTKKPTPFAQLPKATTFADLVNVIDPLVAQTPISDATYIRDDHPAVVATTEVATQWLKTLKEVDYRTYDKTSVLLDLTKKLRDVLVADGSVDDTAQSFLGGKVVSRHEGFNLTAAAFGPNYNSAVLVGEENFAILEATTAWLSSHQFEKGKSYSIGVTLRLLKENDIWKIDAFEFGSAAEVK